MTTREDEVVERVSCGHEAYQGICAHCGVRIIDGIAQTPQRDARIEWLNDQLVETQMRAHNWMVAHDRLKAGKPYDLPKPADLPDALTALSSERDRLREALERARGMICCSVASVDSTMRPLYDEADRQVVLDKIDAALTGSASPR